MKLYCGTYAKYNAGSIDGAWLDLSDFSSKDDFLNACQKLHSDEDDPEFMFQDYEADEAWEKEFYCESFIDEEFWTLKELSAEYGKNFNAIVNYTLNHGDRINSDNIRKNSDRFFGIYDSSADYMESLTEETCQIPDNLKFYIDYEKMARDEELSGDVDFIEIDEISDYGFHHKVAVFYN